jgi:hypothetical protein
MRACDAGAPREVAMARRKSKRWSQRVTESSKALDLESRVFSKDDPRAIALSLKRSALQSKRRKSDPYRSAMSMLTFYINRAGKQLSKKRRATLEAAKNELRQLFGRTPQETGSSAKRKSGQQAGGRRPKAGAKSSVRRRRGKK